MKICKQCGVELEDDMKSCPLCDTISNREMRSNVDDQLQRDGEKRNLMRRVLWQITVVLLLSGVFATLTINLAIIGRITWSIYPIAICLMILAYASLMAWWRTKFIFHLFGGWLISALILVAVDRLSPWDWPLLLAFPLLSTVNILGMALYLVGLKTRGLYFLALTFVALAVASLIIEAIISRYDGGEIVLGWSVIVAACFLPVTAAILFMHFRTRNNDDLRKIFHT